MWISVDDRLPEIVNKNKSEIVIVWNGEPYPARLENFNGNLLWVGTVDFDYICNATHWTTLPSPPINPYNEYGVRK